MEVGVKWATPARRNPVRGIAHSESPSSESSGVTAEERFWLRFAPVAQVAEHEFCKLKVEVSTTSGRSKCGRADYRYVRQVCGTCFLWVQLPSATLS